MQRKKVLNDISEADAAANLSDDEEIVLSNVQTIRKNKRKAEPVIIEEPADDDFIDADTIDENPFPVGTVGYRAFGDESDANAITECNILVVRKPDGAGDNFVKPCKSRMSEPPIRNVELSASESEIEEIVRANCGGGHYYLQTQFGNRHGRGWTVSLSDASDAIAKAKAETAAAYTTAEPTPPAAPPVDPLDSMINSVTKMKALKDILFGDEQNRYEAELAAMKIEIANKPEPPPAQQQPETLIMLEKILASNNPTLIERGIDHLFPQDAGGHWLPETLKMAFDHKDEIAGILGSVLGGLLPKPPPPTQQGIAALLASQPPAAIQAAPPTAIQPSHFQRKVTRSDDGENADTGAHDGKTYEAKSSTEDKNQK